MSEYLPQGVVARTGFLRSRPQPETCLERHQIDCIIGTRRHFVRHIVRCRSAQDLQILKVGCGDRKGRHESAMVGNQDSKRHGVEQNLRLTRVKQAEAECGSVSGKWLATT